MPSGLLFFCFAAVAQATLLTKPPPPIIESGTLNTATVFVGLSGYRDIRCGYTLMDAFTRAANPTRVSFGVVEQLGPGDMKCLDKYCELMTEKKGSCLYKDQIKTYHMDYVESKGPIIARAHQQTLIGGQEFCLQVDAQSEFVSNWDSKLIQQWKDTENDNGILTTYVHDISMRASGERSSVPHVCKTQWGGFNIVRNSQVLLMH
jgi:hypothetical protein